MSDFFFSQVDALTQEIYTVDKKHVLKQYFWGNTKYVKHDDQVIFSYYNDPHHEYHPFIHSKLSYTWEYVLTHLRLSDNDPTLEHQKALQDVLGIYLNGKKIYSWDYLNYDRATKDYQEFMNVYKLNYFFDTHIYTDKDFYLDDVKQQKIENKLNPHSDKYSDILSKALELRVEVLWDKKVSDLSVWEFQRFMIIDYICSYLTMRELLK